MPDAKQVIVLMNLGSPNSPEVRDVRVYLQEFLMDGRVIDTPFLWRTILVNGIIAPFRAPKSAEAYRSIWGADGSPLIAITRQQQQALQALMDVPVEIAMRYGKPGVKSAFDKIASTYSGVSEVVLFPLYPHYAMSSYETAVVQAEEIYKKGKYSFAIKTIRPYYNDPGYINALAESMRPLIGNAHVLFSYHSIPERHVMKSDVTGHHCLKTNDCCNVASAAHEYCYRHQCFVTTQLAARKLGLGQGDFSVSFQSRLGRSEWLKPSTTARMEQLPGEGIKRLAVVCPSFVSDCLETLEEIAIREKENFLKAGGESFTFVPCMNAQPAWISAMANLVRQPRQ